MSGLKRFKRRLADRDITPGEVSKVLAIVFGGTIVAGICFYISASAFQRVGSLDNLTSSLGKTFFGDEERAKTLKEFCAIVENFDKCLGIRSLDAANFNAVIGLFSTLFLSTSIYLTYRQYTASKRMSEKQAQAYLSVKAEPFEEIEGQVIVRLRITNDGVTPAQWLRYRGKFSAQKVGEPLGKIRKSYRKLETTIGPALSPRDSFVFTDQVGLGGNSSIEPLTEGDRLYYAGEILFDDVLDNPHKTEFLLHLVHDTPARWELIRLRHLKD